MTPRNPFFHHPGRLCDRYPSLARRREAAGTSLARRAGGNEEETSVVQTPSRVLAIGQRLKGSLPASWEFGDVLSHALEERWSLWRPNRLLGPGRVSFVVSGGHDYFAEHQPSWIIGPLFLAPLELFSKTICHLRRSGTLDVKQRYWRVSEDRPVYAVLEDRSSKG